MNALFDNPVGRHADRLTTGPGRRWGIAAAVAAAVLLACLIHVFWIERTPYTVIRTGDWSRATGLLVIALTWVAAPWAAARGAGVRRRLQEGGHLSDYRRSRMPPCAIAAGMVVAGVRPVLALVLGCLIITLCASAADAAPQPAALLGVHGLIAVLVLAFGTAGVCLGRRFEHGGIAAALSILALLAATGVVGALDPWYRVMSQPEAWIYAALLANPITAAGSLLDIDVLRFGWVYQRIHAHEYFFVYPPAWQTAGIYLCAAALFFWFAVRRLRYLET